MLPDELPASQIQYLPGEQQAIEEVAALGKKYGYGNLISHLKAAWSKDLQDHYGFDQKRADRAAAFICPWCEIDTRTGKKAEPLS